MSEERGDYGIIPVSPGALLPAIGMDVARHRRDQMVQFVKGIMIDGTDFGAVPGTDKPTLKKAGAEKLKTFFGMTNTFEMIERTEDWDRPLFYYLVRCHLYRDGVQVGEADGSCNSRETKYRYRQGERTCPSCSKTTIRKSKKDSGWYCWSKIGGCGATFKAGDKSIEGQETGRIENPDVADQVNTILKMAEKRALVAAVLITVNASEFFTQDVEDMIDGEYTEAPQPKATTEPAHPNGGGKAVASNPDGPTTPAAALAYVNARVQVPYEVPIHMFNAIKGELGEFKWPATADADAWAIAVDAAIRHAAAKVQQPAAVQPAMALQGEQSTLLDDLVDAGEAVS